MPLRPAKCYRKPERPYTRISYKKPRKGYVKTVPHMKIHKFVDGNPKKKFSLRVSLVSKSHIQIRHNALEAARISVVKKLEPIGSESYFMKVLVYPHHILRENPLATGAGADRFQTGMRMSFGNPISSAAIVKKNQKIISIDLDESKKDIAIKALKIAGTKIPAKYQIVSEKI